MELEAAIAALAYLYGRYGTCQVDLYTDSTYLRQGISHWIDRWFANGWKTKAGGPVKNQALWRKLYDLTHIHRVRWHWVKGHAGHPLNERADQLAREARQAGERCLGDEVPAPTLSPPHPPPEPPLQEVADLPRDAPIEISIAVSCRGAAGPGGWAAVLRAEQARAVLGGHEDKTTGNLLHLEAAIAALQALESPAEVTVYTTSDYLGKGASKWVIGWQRNGWRTSSNKPVQHRERWQALLKAARPHQVTWRVEREGSLPAELTEAKRVAAQEAGEQEAGGQEAGEHEAREQEAGGQGAGRQEASS
jgi:ribonuclease HI